MAVAIALKRLNRVKIHVRLRVVVGDNIGAPKLVKRGALLNFQSVAGKMARFECDRLIQSFGPVVGALIRKSVNEVKAYVFKSGLSSVKDGFFDLLEIMPPSDKLQKLVVRRLCAYGKPVEARAVQKPQILVIDTVGVYFDSNLGIKQHLIVQLQRVKKLN